MRFSFLLLSTLILQGCQTSPVESFKSVKQGQEKREVLEIMGSPDSTWRYQGVDRWKYVMYNDDNTRADQEVHFQDGKATYIGKPMEAIVSADEQDTLNDKTNAEVKKQMEDNWKARFKGMESYEESVRPTTQPTPLPTFNEIR